MGWRDWFRSEPKIGGIYSIDGYDREAIRVAKVLKFEKPIIHLRIYKQKFTARPRSADLTELSLGSVHDSDGYGVGHIPISERQFGAWRPEFLVASEVSKAELEGYEIWREDGEGSYFDLGITKI